MTTSTPTGAFALVDTSTGRTTHADSLSELVDRLVTGHADASAADQLGLRLDALVALANRAQAIILASTDLTDFDDDELTALFHDRATEVVGLAEWTSPTELLLIAQNYEPYTQEPRPVGEQIIWLDAADERTFLASFDAAGVAKLLVRSAADSGAD